MIGVAFVAAAVVVGDLIASLFTREHLAVVLQEKPGDRRMGRDVGTAGHPAL